MRVNGLTRKISRLMVFTTSEVVYNPDYDTLYQEELNPALEGYERGVLTNRVLSPSIRVFYRSFAER